MMEASHGSQNGTTKLKSIIPLHWGSEFEALSDNEECANLARSCFAREKRLTTISLTLEPYIIGLCRQAGVRFVSACAVSFIRAQFQHFFRDVASKLSSLKIVDENQISREIFTVNIDTAKKAVKGLALPCLGSDHLLLDNCDVLGSYLDYCGNTSNEFIDDEKFPALMWDVFSTALTMVCDDMDGAVRTLIHMRALCNAHRATYLAENDAPSYSFVIGTLCTTLNDNLFGYVLAYLATATSEETKTFTQFPLKWIDLQAQNIHSMDEKCFNEFITTSTCSEGFSALHQVVNLQIILFAIDFLKDLYATVFHFEGY